MEMKNFDFGAPIYRDPTKRLDPSFYQIIDPHLCGRWNQESATFFYHAALAISKFEMALNACLLRSSDLSDCEIEFVKRLFAKACSEGRADIVDRLKTGRLKSGCARVLLKHYNGN